MSDRLDVSDKSASVAQSQENGFHEELVATYRKPVKDDCEKKPPVVEHKPPVVEHKPPADNPADKPAADATTPATTAPKAADAAAPKAADATAPKAADAAEAPTAAAADAAPRRALNPIEPTTLMFAPLNNLDSNGKPISTSAKDLDLTAGVAAIIRPDRSGPEVQGRLEWNPTENLSLKMNNSALNLSVPIDVVNDENTKVKIVPGFTYNPGAEQTFTKYAHTVDNGSTLDIGLYGAQRIGADGTSLQLQGNLSKSLNSGDQLNYAANIGVAFPTSDDGVSNIRPSIGIVGKGDQVEGQGGVKIEGRDVEAGIQVTTGGTAAINLGFKF